jgi:alpha-amylase/alpha-mannosidase (GH57 family)
MKKKLTIAFFWHMHQPLYKDPHSSEYILPWVLLHATKDYYGMAAILKDFPAIRQTFNLVPSLIEQIQDYASGNAKDRYRKLSLKDPHNLTKDEKIYILEKFFQANWDKMIRPHKRYYELLIKRGFSNDVSEETAGYFTGDDIQDIQLYFNLVWIDPSLRRDDKRLMAIEKKGSSFTEEEKKYVLNKQIEIAASVIDLYKEMEASGAVELTTTPYYHPIMPLLCDMNSARQAMPKVELPEKLLKCPEDAEAQIKNAISFHKKTFGKTPSGMWPSEGSVSDEVLTLIKGEGIGWVATDEEILSETLGRSIQRDAEGNAQSDYIYRPYSLGTDSGMIDIIFRDHLLSDLIGFEYATWEVEDAVDDFMERLEKIYTFSGDPSENIVSIILDGENAWETYDNDGEDFLRALYTRLSRDERFECSTISQALSNIKTREKIDSIHSGSWINKNFSIWIGHDEDNRAWNLLESTRNTLLDFAKNSPKEDAEIQTILKAAWDEIYASEGSDWFWWYGDDHTTLTALEFDALFRGHLIKVYELICIPIPEKLLIPIIRTDKEVCPAKSPSGLIEPRIDGEVTNYFEWLAAGVLECSFVGGAMHRVSQGPHGGGGGILERIHFGFSLENFYIRLDYLKELLPYSSPWSFSVSFLGPLKKTYSFTVHGSSVTGDIKDFISIASGDITETSFVFKELELKPAEDFEFIIEVDGAERGTERWPLSGTLKLTVPTLDYEAENWMI